MAFIVALVAVLTLVGGLATRGHNSALRSRGVHTVGRDIGPGKALQDRIEYSTPQGNFVASMARPRAGDLLPGGGVDVIYDPQNPNVAQVAHFVKVSGVLDGVLIGVGAVGVVAGVGLFVGGILLLRRRRPPPAVPYPYPAPGGYPVG